jgi:uncharacterized membrane protein
VSDGVPGKFFISFFREIQWPQWALSSFGVWMGLILGGLFAIIIPPFQSPDEYNHFFRAWQISEGSFFPEKKDQRLGAELPLSLGQLRDSFLYLKYDTSTRLAPSTLDACLNLPLNQSQREFTDFANTAIYSPTAYVPQVAAIAAARALGATPLQCLYGARLANLLCWLLLVSWAINRMPFLANTLWAVALLPASLCMAASANAEITTNGLSWCLVAILLTNSRFLSSSNTWLATIIISLNKLITVPLALLGGLVQGKWLPSLALFGAGVLAAVVWGQCASDWFIPYDAYNVEYRDSQTLNPGVNPQLQWAWVIQEPFAFLRVIASSFFEALPSMTAHFTGKFGWGKNYLPSQWIAVLCIMMALLLMTEKNPLSKWQRLGMAFLAVVYLLAFALTIYLLWYPVGSTQFDNWQGRYFMPIAPLMAMAIAGGFLKIHAMKIERMVLIVLIMSNIAMTCAIMERY